MTTELIIWYSRIPLPTIHNFWIRHWWCNGCCGSNFFSSHCMVRHFFHPYQQLRIQCSVISAVVYIYLNAAGTNNIWLWLAPPLPHQYKGPLKVVHGPPISCLISTLCRSTVDQVKVSYCFHKNEDYATINNAALFPCFCWKPNTN